MKVTWTKTEEVELTPKMAARAFCEWSATEQADFFNEVAQGFSKFPTKSEEGRPLPERIQEKAIGEHVTRAAAALLRVVAAQKMRAT